MNYFLVLSNAGYVLIGNFFSFPFQVLTSILIARSLGVVSFGVYSFMLEFSLIFSRAGLFGFHILSSREIARNKERGGEYLANLLFMQIVTGIIFFITMIFAYNLFASEKGNVYLLSILGLANFMGIFTLLFYGVFQAHEKMYFEGGISFIKQVVYLIAVTIVVFLLGRGNELRYMVWCLFAAELFVLISSLAIIKNYFMSIICRLDIGFIKYVLREASPLAAGMILMVIYDRVNVLVLKAQSTDTQVALFNLPFYLSYQFALIAAAFTSAWLPSLSRESISSPEQFNRSAGQLYRMIILVSIPIAVGLSLIATPLINFLYGREFSEAGPVLKVLIWAMMLLFFNMGSKTLLESRNQQTKWMVALIVGLMCSVVLNFCLVPVMGSLGAAFATLAANLAVSLFLFVWVIPLVNCYFIAGIFTRALAYGVIMGGGIYLLMSISWVLAFLAGIIIYGALLIFTKEVSLGEMISFFNYIFNSIKNRR